MSSESDTDIEQDLENVDAAGGFSESDSSSDEDCEFVEPFADTTKFAKHADIIECTDGDVLPEPKLARLLGPYSLFKRLLTQSIMLLFVENSPIINTTVGELTVHFALLMLMGLQPRHRLKEHWDMKLGNSDFRDAMPRDRWLEIWNNLRTYDGVSHPNDPRRLVLDLVTQISDSFQEQLIPGSNKCVDECIGAFFGKRSPQSFFLPRKPSRQKNGLKFQALNDSVSAYMWCVFMQPRGKRLPEHLQQLCTPDGVLGHMIETLHEKHPSIPSSFYCDRWYTTLKVAHMCATEYHVHFTGTLSKSRVPEREAPALRQSCATAPCRCCCCSCFVCAPASGCA